MVIDQLQTTYRRDYIPPYPNSLLNKTTLTQNHPTLCECKKLQPQAPDLFAKGDENVDWTRMGPMGPLLDPKIYPARVSTAPETDVAKHDQPNTFLKRLKEKYPFIYECMSGAPPSDVLSRINRDRLRSTYQIDFCLGEEFPTHPYDDLVRAAAVMGVSPCVEPTRLPGDGHIPIQKPIAFRPASISKRVGGGKPIVSSAGKNGTEKKNCVGTCHGPLASITAGTSEYQDNISRLGQLIIREKILH